MRLRRLVLTAAIGVTAAATLFAGPTVRPAHGEPDTLEEAKAQLEKIETEQSQIGEDYSQIQMQLGEGRAKVALLNKDIEAQQLKVDTLRSQATTVALTQFQNRGVDSTVQLITSVEPESFLSQMSTARKVDENMNSLLQDFQAQQANLADLRRSADAEVASLGAEEKRLADLDAKLKAKVKEGEDLVSRLSEQQRQRLLADQRSSRSDTRTVVTKTISVSGANGKALGAVRYAVSKVPSGQYVWGAEGPSAFDCSGLMLAAYRSVGISLPHSSRAQFGAGRAVSRNELKPGDLLFFYSPISHVGMYMGNGLFVHARNPRNDLEITRLSSYPAYQGARRVTG